MRVVVSLWVSSLLGWRVVMIALVGLLAWCAARSLLAHLDRRGDCACCAGVSVRGSSGMGGAAFGSFLVVFGELPSGRPSIFGKSLETPGAQFMSVGKL